MNHRKHKQARNQRKIKMYTPDGYFLDPPDSFCPYCGKKNKPCSHVNSLSRAWARGACKKINNNKLQ
jgi:prepilin signal peptidase PulO-like enzyme (type II secretory pathway)